MPAGKTQNDGMELNRTKSSLIVQQVSLLDCSSCIRKADGQNDDDDQTK